MGVTEQLARFAIETPPGFLTPPLARSISEKFLDTIGIMVAGARSAASEAVLKTVMESGGHPDATVIGRSERTSVLHAGYVNGVSAHALEYDDNTPDVGHVSACMVPGCLAIAEKMNLSGTQVAEAFAIGYEIAGRISIGLKPALFDRGWHSPGLIGGLGVAVAGCRLMGLGSMQTRMAIGIMASSGTGIRKNVGSAGKAFHIGNGVRSGLMAAQLARNGFRVDPDVIEGSDAAGEGHQRFGLADTFSGANGYSLERMREGLGGEFILTRRPTRVRMHPGATITGPAIDGILELAATRDIKPADVDEIRVKCHPLMLVIASYSEPQDTYRAKFCPPYTFAVALIDRKVGIAQYTEQRIRDPQVLALMRRVKVSVRDDIRAGDGESLADYGEADIAITLKDGRVLTKRAVHARGWPGLPASWDDLSGKFVECSSGVLSQQQMRRAIGMIAALPEIPSIRDLMTELAVNP